MVNWLTLSQIQKQHGIGKAAVKAAIATNRIRARKVRNGKSWYWQVDRESLLRCHGLPLQSPHGDNPSEKACVNFYLARHCSEVINMAPEMAEVWKAGQRIYNERKQWA